MHPNFTNRLHGDLKFGPLPPLSRDGICMPKQVWSIDFPSEIYDHVINSLRMAGFRPRLLENFENWKNFILVVILLNVKNAYRRIFGA